MAKTNKIAGDYFFEAVGKIDNGTLQTELDRKLKQLIQDVQDTGNKGAITLKLEVKKKGASNQVFISSAVSMSQPKRDTPSRLIFIDADGELHEDDPLQGKLELDAPVKVAPFANTIAENIKPVKVKMVKEA